MNSTTRQFKSNLTLAFKMLRLLGYLCKQNHTCCNSCGWAEIPEDASDKVVFYHWQDTDCLKENSSMLYLSWSGNHEEIIKVLELCKISASCEDPERTKICCLTGNPITPPSSPPPVIQEESEDEEDDEAQYSISRAFEEQYEERIEENKTKLRICFNNAEMEGVLSKDKAIVLRQETNCYCYSAPPVGFLPQPEIKTIPVPYEGKPITRRDCCEAIVKSNWKCCNHYFLEFLPLPDENGEVVLGLGS